MPFTTPWTHRIHQPLVKIMLCASLLAASSILFAQDGLRRVAGIVTDSDHEPLAGAVVELHDDTTDTVTSCITNRTGHYTFKRLPLQDDYHVWAKFHGHKSRSKSLSRFDSKPNRDLILVVKVE